MRPEHRHHDEADQADERPPSRRLAPPSSDMNVTPLIDVLLVLLVTFMAALPLTQGGLDIHLPLEQTAQETPPDLAQIVIELTPDLQLNINRQPVPFEGLEQRLRELFQDRADRTVFVLGPAAARYGDIVSIIDVARGLDLRIAIVTERMRSIVQPPR